MASKSTKILYLGAPSHTSASIRKQFQDHLEITTDLQQTLHASTRTELLEKLPHTIAARGPFQGVVCRLGTQAFEPFDAEVFAPLLPDLSIVVSAQRGYNDFDVDWLASSGVFFCNTANATGAATADLALFMILALLRNTSRAERNVRLGRWREGLGLAKDPAGLTLGIVGMGSIARCLAVKAQIFGMRIRYYTRDGHVALDAPPDAHHCGSLSELLRCSDVVSLHCPLTPNTEHLIGRSELAEMRDGSYIINTSRGSILDSDALVDALDSGKLAGAGLDVFEGEPFAIHPYLLKSDRVVMQPHMGGLTEGSFERVEGECLGNVDAWRTSGKPLAHIGTCTPVTRHDSPLCSP